ncbi:MAG: hypothetical protein U0905_10610 [Pirellulales bacterium]
MGIIEIHRCSVDGPLLGETSVEVNGDRESFYEKGGNGSQSMPKTLILSFVTKRNRVGWLKNLDAIEFLRP